MTTESDSGPYAEVVIVELGGGIAGALCGKLFSDLGADIIKVEPSGGDDTRSLPPLKQSATGPPLSGMHAFLNARKRSVVLDVETRSGREALHILLRSADAVIDSRPLNPDDDPILALRSDLSALVWLRITPFGMTGPWRYWKGHDLAFQSIAGGMYGWGATDGPPLRAPGRASELLTGACAAAMLAVPLRANRRERLGQLIDISQVGSQLLTATLGLMRFSYIGAISQRIHLPFPGVMKCADGFVGINLLTDDHWRRLCSMFGLDALLEDPRFANPAIRIEHADELYEIFDPLMRQRTRDELFEEGNERNQIPISPVLTAEDVLGAEHLNVRGYFADQALPDGSSVRMPSNYIRASGMPFAPLAPAPLVGEHTVEVLSALGLTNEAIEELSLAGEH